MLPDAQSKLASPRWRAFAELCGEIAGLPRHISQHPGGMVISSRPLVELVPGAAVRDGGPADVPVGQGLVRRRRLPEDRPARARDAVGGRGVRRRWSRAPAASRSTSRASRSTTPTSSRRSRGRHGRLLPDREPCADADDPAHAAGEPRRHHDPGRARPARARSRAKAVHPYIERRQRLREDPAYEPPVDHPLLARAAARDARRRRLPGPGARRRDRSSPASRVGEAEGLRRAMSRKRSHAALEAYRDALRRGRARRRASTRRLAHEVYDKLVALLRLRLPEVALGCVRPARVPVGVAAPPLPRRVPRRAAERAADGLLSAGDARPRRAAARRRDAAAGRERERRRLRHRGRRRPRRAEVRAGCRRGRCGGRRRRARRERPVRLDRRARAAHAAVAATSCVRSSSRARATRSA